jgi:hypothetical protein
MAAHTEEPPERADGARSLRDLPAFSPQPWQMSYGERTVVEGMLAMLKPQLSIEIGRAEGGSLRRIAEHSDEVVSFDIVDPSRDLAELANVTMLTGDSHVLLPNELKRIADDDHHVDFVLVDGDHSASGVRDDMRDLLTSEAITRTVILAHDTLNEEVRQGLEEVDYEANEKVAWVDLDFIPGYVARLPERFGECWGGIGLIVVDASGTFRGGAPQRGKDLFEQPKLIWPTVEWIRCESESSGEFPANVTLVAESLLAQAQQELSESRREASTITSDLERHQAWLHGIEHSVSWRLTSPLRTLKHSVRKRRF